MECNQIKTRNDDEDPEYTGDQDSGYDHIDPNRGPSEGGCG